MRLSKNDWGLLLFLSILWGGAFFLVSVAVREIPPFTIVILRTGVAAIVLVFAVSWVQKLSIPSVIASAWHPAFFAMGALNNLIPFSLFVWAQTLIPGGLAAILNATTPIFAMLVAHCFLSDERLALGKVAGILTGFLGVAILIEQSAIGGATLELAGVVACLGAALSYGFAGVYGRRFAGFDLSASQVALGQLLSSTIIMMPVVLVVDQPWKLPLPSGHVLLSLLILSVFCTALAYIVFFRILKSSGAVNVALVTLLMPAVTITLGATFLDEMLEPQHYAGLAILGVGLLIIDGRIIRMVRSVCLR